VKVRFSTPHKEPKVREREEVETENTPVSNLPRAKRQARLKAEEQMENSIEREPPKPVRPKKHVNRAPFPGLTQEEIDALTPHEIEFRTYQLKLQEEQMKLEYF
jgi:hypothetical protein